MVGRSRTSIVGRETELETLQSYITDSEVGLVSLYGPAGCGKSRIALEAARRAESRRQRVVFVDLSLLAEPSLLVPTLCRELRVPRGDSLASLVSAMESHEFVVVLDNCESADDVLPVVSAVMDGCPGATVVVTCRRVLGVYGEMRLPVRPLPTPRVVSTTRDEELLASPAVQLFVRRAKAVRPDFQPRGEILRDIAMVCADLDGLPLAIELAAARVSILAPRELRAETLFDDEGRFAEEGSIGFPGGMAHESATRRMRRHQSLRRALEWSCSLLREEEALVLLLISAFPGGATREHLTSLLADLPEMRTRAGESRRGSLVRSLDSLIAQGLVFYDEPRFRTLNTIRAFIQRWMSEPSRLGPRRVAALRSRHAEMVSGLVCSLAGELVGPSQAEAFVVLEGEHANLSAATGCLIYDGTIVAAAEMLVALLPYWERRSFHGEGLQWCSRVLASADDAPSVPLPPKLHADLLYACATLAWTQADWGRAVTHHTRALEIYRSIGDGVGEALALNGLGACALDGGDAGDAVARIRAAEELFRREGYDRGVAMAVLNLGVAAMDAGEFEDSRTLLESALEAARRCGDIYLESAIHHNLGEVSRSCESYGEAADYLARARFLADRIGVPRVRIAAEISLAMVHLRTGDEAAAESILLRVLPEAYDLHFRNRVAECFDLLAAIRFSGAADDMVVTLLGKAAAIRESVHWDRLPPDESAYRTLIERVRGANGEVAFAVAHAEGRSASTIELIGEVSAAAGEPNRVPPSGRTGARQSKTTDESGLTRREREVAALVAEGLTNQEIGDTLFIVVKTVEKHVGNILMKLGFANRAEIAAWAATHGISAPP